MKTFINTLIIILPLLTINLYCSAKSDLNWPEIQQCLSEVQTYQHGQSLESLTRLDSLIRIVNDRTDRQQIEREMISRIQSDCTPAGKQQICRRLHFIGTDISVPVLLKMLDDSLTFDMAIYALELIPDPSADREIYRLFKENQDGRKIGLINSIGARKVQEAIPDLAELISVSDPGIAAAAINALTEMPAEKTIQIFINAIANSPAHLQNRLIDASLQSAGNLADKKTALQFLRKMYDNDFPAHFRINALRKIIRIDQETGTALVLLAVAGKDPVLRSGALSVTDMLDESASLNKLIDNAPALSPDEQILLIEAIGRRTENKYPDMLKMFVRSESEQVRIAALKNLRQIGQADIAIFLAKSAATSTGKEKDTARESLYLINGKDIDQTIMNTLPVADIKLQYELIRSAGERMIAGSSNSMLKYAAGQNSEIRKIALQSLRQVASPQDIPGLTDLLLQTSVPNEENILTAILSDLVGGMADMNTRGNEILARVADTNDPGKLGLLFQILGVSGNPKALNLLVAAAENNDGELQDAAIRALSRWPDIAPHSTLSGLITTAGSEKNQILAYRGYLDLLQKPNELAPDSLYVLFANAFSKAPNINEKKRAFSAISHVPGFAAIDLLLPFLDNPQLTAEAETAIILISWQIIDRDNNRLRPVITRILSDTSTPATKEQAQNLLQEMN